MSDVKHTPGPWRWSDEYTSGDGRRTWSLLGQGGYGILSCDGVGNAPQGLGDGANARLIAAAPDLLEALRPFADIGVSENPDYQPMIRMDRAAILAARAAIAKAEGRE